MENLKYQVDKFLKQSSEGYKVLVSIYKESAGEQRNLIIICVGITSLVAVGSYFITQMSSKTTKTQ